MLQIRVIDNIIIKVLQSFKKKVVIKIIYLILIKVVTGITMFLLKFLQR